MPPGQVCVHAQRRRILRAMSLWAGRDWGCEMGVRWEYSVHCFWDLGEQADGSCRPFLTLSLSPSPPSWDEDVFSRAKYLLDDITLA